MSLVNTYTAIFNSNNLNSIAGVTVLGLSPYRPAKRNLNSFEVARSSIRKVNSAFYESKQIPVRIGITRATRELAEQSLDLLMNAVQGVEKELLVNQSGGTRKYIATFSDYDMVLEANSYLELVLLFDCSDSYGYDTAQTTVLTITNYTGANKIDQIGVGGSAPSQALIMTYTLTTISGGTGKTVTVGNDLTGQTISIHRDWVSGDRLVVDPTNQDHPVTVNGNDVLFTGAIPEWATGVGRHSYADDFTSRTFSASIVHNRRYV